LLVLVFLSLSPTEPDEEGSGTGDGESKSGGITGTVADGEDSRVDALPFSPFSLGIFPGEGVIERGKSKLLDGELRVRESGRGNVGRGEGFRPKGSCPSPSIDGDIWGEGSKAEGNTSGNRAFGDSRSGVGTVWGVVSASGDDGVLVDGEGSFNSTIATPTTTKDNAANLAS
jgi:hypothetical protein